MLLRIVSARISPHDTFLILNRANASHPEHEHEHNIMCLSQFMDMTIALTPNLMYSCHYGKEMNLAQYDQALRLVQINPHNHSSYVCIPGHMVSPQATLHGLYIEER